MRPVLRLRIRPPRPIARILRWISLNRPPRNFISLHYAYFIAICMLSSIIFWGSSTPARSITYTDSLFLVVSAMTLAGLNTINLSQINTFQQFLLFLLTLLGSAVFVSIAMVHIRKKAFERKFKSIAENERQRRRGRSGSRGRLSFSTPGLKRDSKPEIDENPVRARPSMSVDTASHYDGANGDVILDHSNPDRGIGQSPESITEPNQISDHGTEKDDQTTVDEGMSRRIAFASPSSPVRARPHTRVFSMQGVGARHQLLNHPNKTSRPEYPWSPPATENVELGSPNDKQDRYGLSGFIGRNSQFSSLTLAERERLGGVEYRAVTFLSVIVPMYFFLWQFLGCLGLGAYVARNRPGTARDNGLNPWWVGAFNAVSAFNNNGMMLLDANMVAFQTSNYMLITMGLLILAGNTCYPIFLRLIIWTLLKLMPDIDRFREHRVTLRFLLDHPRRCYTTLFPSSHTWWLLAILVLLNGIDWIAFEVLNIGNSMITSLPPGVRVIDGLFQALAVRSGGFYVVSIAQLRISLLILYVLMMYISVYPVAITMRNSNVYEERSLGIYADDPQEKSEEPKGGVFKGLRRRLTSHGGPMESRSDFVRQQLRGQLAHDLWWIVLAVLFIMITETGQFENDPINYSVFNVIFEVISAYGCVGISVGLPNVAYSFCGGWHVLSKLILCAVMLRGRHRGLPVAIDRAVLLPSEHLTAAEEEDAQIRMDRSMTRTMSRGQGV